MRFEKYGSMSEKKIRKDLKKVLTVDTYDASAAYNAKDDKWCLTELVSKNSLPAIIARCYVHGLKSNGGKVENLDYPIAKDLKITLQVLSRQACKYDKDRNEIITNAKSLDDCTPHDEKPQEGDIVVVQRDMKMLDEDEQPIGHEERDMMMLNGESLYNQIEVEVDKHGCIVVDYVDAESLLSTKGARIVKPQFNPKTSGLGREDQKLERKITNWLFKETISAEERKRIEDEKKAKIKAKKAAEAKAKKELEEKAKDKEDK